MMILNLINIIAIAMGIGTSAKNTSFEYEKKTNRKAIETINETLNYSQVGTLITYGSTDPGSTYDTMGKYLISNNVSWHNDQIMIQTTNYVRLRNVYRANGTDIHQFSSLFDFIEIYNYYDSDITLNLNIGCYTGSTQMYTYSGNVYKTEISIDDVQDLTLNNTTYQTIINKATLIVSNANTERLYYNVINQNTEQQHDPSFSDTLTTGEITINGHNKVNIYMAATIQYNPDSQTAKTWENIALRPSNLQIQGTVNVTDRPKTIEVVNIPQIMFTILAMPFSFISQAFNLTIFPDTPYSINFSNLFITIIAIFILLWLIKHIFK